MIGWPVTSHSHRILHRADLHRGTLERRTEWNAGVENNLTRGQGEKEERKCVLVLTASQPEHLCPPVTDSDSVVEP